MGRVSDIYKSPLIQNGTGFLVLQQARTRPRVSVASFRVIQRPRLFSSYVHSRAELRPPVQREERG